MGLRILGHMVAVMALAPLLPGLIARTKAFLTGRRGQPLLQPYYDIGKLLRKGSVYSTATTWIFQAAPVVFMAAVLGSSVLMPFGGFKAPLSFWGDIILFAYLYGLARFFVILAAWDTGSSFEGMGASRDAAFSCLSEIVLFLDFIVLALLSKSLMLAQMIEGNILTSWQLFAPAMLLVAASYFLVLLTENARIPIDDPATHLELTMIHEVMVLDHSGRDLAWIWYAGAIKLFVLGGLFVNILIPAHNVPPPAQTVLFTAGMILLAVVIGVVESCMARLRLNRVPQMLIGAFVLAFIGLLVVLIKGV